MEKLKFLKIKNFKQRNRLRFKFIKFHESGFELKIEPMPRIELGTSSLPKKYKNINENILKEKVDCMFNYKPKHQTLLEYQYLHQHFPSHHLASKVRVLR